MCTSGAIWTFNKKQSSRGINLDLDLPNVYWVKFGFVLHTRKASYFCARSVHHEREVLSAGVQGPKGPKHKGFRCW